MDDYIGNCRAGIEPFVETFVEIIVRFPSILVLYVSRASSRALSLRGDSLRPPCVLYTLFTACRLANK